MEGLILITDGQTWWAIQVSCYALNLGNGHLTSTQILILGHLHHLQTISHRHSDKLVFDKSFFGSSSSHCDQILQLMSSCWKISL